MTDPASPAPLRKQGHPRAVAARARRRAEAEAAGVDAAFISDLVEGFYGRIRADAVLGPIFARHIVDWAPHLDRMKAFWRSILHNSAEFSGNPMQRHAALHAAGSPLGEAEFARWLGLFYATCDDLAASRGLDPAAARQVSERARMIADSLLTGIATREHGLAAARAGDGLPRP
ncbi:group III truncated hemoglobin [Novosphingobium bradum]|uniref:Group III truncated hemoglobin n=1 Tax=Novosphingobium bradum TaxID=1737444 RepID=A0ABV7ILP8_9SPHN